MDYALLFNVVNLSVLPAWALLIFAPRAKLTDKLVHSMFYPVVLGLIYSAGLFMAVFGGHGADGGGFDSIEAVRALFASDVGITIGWAHYLVFDLFAGAWMARDALRRNFRHAVLIPCLLFTFLAGPLGLLLYVVLRKLTGKGGWSLEG